ncbi:hypothetical protein CASFOL_011103 [Castilleja foliolosa]|uniref:Homeobox domain-containing protein n=1 Tax=Castilleja foliolosa TaxID=1961234 RepID=A0ABD3DUI0_9LAMI
MNLRPRQNQLFSGFTKAEVEKKERLFDESKEQSPEMDFYKNLARSFNGQTYFEVRSWFEKKRRNGLLKETSFDSDILRNKATEDPISPENAERMVEMYPSWCLKQGRRLMGHGMMLIRLSPTDLSVQEVYVRYAGFGAAEDEWVNVNSDVRERSIA